jgi:glycosyltransferase involved in cell wall biosynthesis
MKEQRVCMLVHNHYLRDTRVRREAESLAAAGFSVYVVSLQHPESVGGHENPRPKVVKGVSIYEVPIAKKRGGGLRYFFEYGAMLLIGAWKILRMHMHKRFDIIHIHNMPDFLVLAGLLPKLMGAKLILDVHDPMVELYRSMKNGGESPLVLKALAWQERISCWLADKVISVNETMRENLEGKSIPPEKIFIVNNFPDLSNLPIRTRDVSWPRKDGCLKLLYTGTVTDHYDLGVAVRAIALAAKEIPNLVLRIVGTGNKVSQIREIADELGITGRIEFLGYVHIEKVREEMERADVGISSHKAGIFGDLYFSTKIVEFMTQGLPVVCSRTYTIQKCIPEDAIFYFEPGDYEDMAQKILTIWRDPKLVAQKNKNASTLLSRLSWESEKVKLVEFYNSLVGLKGGCYGKR